MAAFSGQALLDSGVLVVGSHDCSRWCYKRGLDSLSTRVMTCELELMRMEGDKERREEEREGGRGWGIWRVDKQNVAAGAVIKQLSSSSADSEALMEQSL